MLNKKGVTLIELLVSLLIIGIIAASAAPTLSNIKSDSEFEDLANDLKMDLMTARLAAITESKNINFVLKQKEGSVFYLWMIDHDGKTFKKQKQEDTSITIPYHSIREFSFSSYGFLIDKNGNQQPSEYFVLCHLEKHKAVKYTLNALGKVELEEIKC